MAVHIDFRCDCCGHTVFLPSDAKPTCSDPKCGRHGKPMRPIPWPNNKAPTCGVK